MLLLAKHTFTERAQLKNKKIFDFINLEGHIVTYACYVRADRAAQFTAPQQRIK